jgi:hypothetical protein
MRPCVSNVLRNTKNAPGRKAYTGRHVNGGCTILWGLVHEEGQPLPKDDVEAAFREAGFDFQHDQRVPTLAGILCQPTKTGDHGRNRRELAGV